VRRAPHEQDRDHQSRQRQQRHEAKGPVEARDEGVADHLEQALCRRAALASHDLGPGLGPGQGSLDLLDLLL
jgi:hypothetical protein